MPAYGWTCHACGTSNSRDAHACVACACPAEATSAVIASHRSTFVAAGGTLQRTAADAATPDAGAFDILVRPILFVLFGWWVPRLSGLRTDRR